MVEGSAMRGEHGLGAWRGATSRGGHWTNPLGSSSIEPEIRLMHRASAAVALAALLMAPSVAAQSGRVEICHRIQAGGAFHLIEVDASAVPSHLAHGDTLASGGTCSEPAPIVPCGGFAGFPCPPGTTCIDVPDDGCDPECGAADCMGYCVTFPPASCVRGECPDGFTCIDDPRDACDPDCGDANCPTICAEVLPDTCGGIASLPCPAGYECVEMAGDGCSTRCGGADCGGRCVVYGPVPCEGRRDDCPAGSVCADDFRDDCGPECEADCPRICVTPVPGP
jgi:hypothetical protein